MPYPGQAAASGCHEIGMPAANAGAATSGGVADPAPGVAGAEREGDEPPGPPGPAEPPEGTDAVSRFQEAGESVIGDAQHTPACNNAPGGPAAAPSGMQSRAWWPRWDAPARAAPVASAATTARTAAVALGESVRGRAVAGAPEPAAARHPVNPAERGRKLMVFDVRYPNKKVRTGRAAHDSWPQRRSKKLVCGFLRIVTSASPA